MLFHRSWFFSFDQRIRKRYKPSPSDSKSPSSFKQS
jgi:hypothetical protein